MHSTEPSGESDSVENVGNSEKAGNSPIMTIAFVVWGLLVVGGMWQLTVYSNTAGAAATPADRWPTEVAIERHAGASTLMMFAHPRCPCTRSSISELARLMARTEGGARAHVVFFRPEESAGEWCETDLWESAAAIPRVDVHDDAGGAIAAQFGAVTSGQVLLYGDEGQLLFHGGITAARGHEGGNVGTTMIQQLVAHRDVENATTPVFGCSLCEPENEFGPSQEPQQESNR